MDNHGNNRSTRRCRRGSSSAPSIGAHFIQIPLPRDFAAHRQQLATLEQVGVLGEGGVYGGSLGDEAPQLEHFLQHCVIELNVCFHIAHCTCKAQHEVHDLMCSMYTSCRSLGPLSATCAPLRSDAQHLEPVDQPMRWIHRAGTPWAMRLVATSSRRDATRHESPGLRARTYSRAGARDYTRAP